MSDPIIFKPGDKIHFKTTANLVRPLEPQETVSVNDVPVVLDNKRGNKWWAKIADFTAIVVCLDGEFKQLPDGTYSE